MSELRLESSLSQEEIEVNFKDTDLFSELMAGLSEALAYSKGTPSAETVTRKRSLPDVNVRALRSSLNMTQRVFANVLGVSCRTVEAWESGRSNPTPTAKKLMVLIKNDHALVKTLLSA